MPVLSSPPDHAETDRPVDTPRPRHRPGAKERTAHRWTVLAHTYTSMISLLVILFFGFTGITLNHPTWTFGDAADETRLDGVLPPALTADESLALLEVSEFARDELGVRGDIDDFSLDESGGALRYTGPGYSADLTFSSDDLTYELVVEEQGWLAVLNDLHKGRDTNSSWSWVIDISGALLVLVAVTGLTLQFFLRRRRRSAYAVALGGTVVSVAFMVFTLA